VALVENYRLHEFRIQVEAMLRGIRAIVPSPLLTLFTWRELQRRICGQPEIDIELLKVNLNKFFAFLSYTTQSIVNLRPT
jgi:hypothetical protein